MISYIQNLFYNDSIPPKWPVEKSMGGFQNFFEIGSKPMLWVRFPLTTLFLWTISWKDQFFNFSQWIWIFSEFWKIMKMIYLDCQWIDLFPVIKCCRDVLWRHINLLYIYLTVVYLAGWNYHSLKFSKISQNFIFPQKNSQLKYAPEDLSKNCISTWLISKNSNQILRITTTCDHFWPNMTSFTR